MSRPYEIACKRIHRVCNKIRELLQEDIDGEMEDSLDNIQRAFLVICESLHTNIDMLECESAKECTTLYDDTHASIEAMYDQLHHLTSQMKAFLAYGTRDWFNHYDDAPTCLPSHISELRCKKEDLAEGREPEIYCKANKEVEVPFRKEISRKKPEEEKSGLNHFLKMMGDRLENELFSQPEFTESVKNIEKVTEVPLTEVIKKVGDALECRFPQSESSGYY